jgi:hypothetical protein
MPTLVIDVLADAGTELDVEVAAAEADADANEDPALGGCGSGVILVRSVSQVAPPSGLRLRSRSPSPSNRAWRIILRDLSKLFDALLRACTLSDKVGRAACCERVRKGSTLVFHFRFSTEEENKRVQYMGLWMKQQERSEEMTYISCVQRCLSSKAKVV